MQGTRSNSSFFSVIDMEVAETATSFLAFQDTYWRRDFFVCRCSSQCDSGPWPCPCPFWQVFVHCDKRSHDLVGTVEYLCTRSHNISDTDTDQ